MSVQQNVTAVRISDRALLDQLQASLVDYPDVVLRTTQDAHGGLIVALESHALMPGQLHDLLAATIGDHWQAHTLNVDERLEMFAGNDPYADHARG